MGSYLKLKLKRSPAQEMKPFFDICQRLWDCSLAKGPELPAWAELEQASQSQLPKGKTTLESRLEDIYSRKWYETETETENSPCYYT